MKCLRYLPAVIAVASTLILAAPSSSPRADKIPYLGVEPHVNKGCATKLEEAIAYFESQNDSLNAARTRTVQKVPTEWNDSWDEFYYLNNLVPHLESAGFPAHFIVDQGRSGKAGIRTSWSQWCNIKSAGFGTRPTADQAVLQNANVDAIVWGD